MTVAAYALVSMNAVRFTALVLLVMQQVFWLGIAGKLNFTLVEGLADMAKAQQLLISLARKQNLWVAPAINFYKTLTDSQNSSWHVA
eukprot:5093748-Amphidinium_carterae.3